ncbi:MAG: hypothetical protein ACOVT5_02395, partial [Armatimonadaceae bacterium]
ATTRAERTLLRALIEPTMRHLINAFTASQEIGALFGSELHRGLAALLTEKPDPDISQLTSPELVALYTELSVGTSSEEPLDDEAVRGCFDFLVRNQADLQARQIMELGQDQASELGTEDLRNWYRLLREKKGQPPA